MDVKLCAGIFQVDVLIVCEVELGTTLSMYIHVRTDKNLFHLDLLLGIHEVFSTWRRCMLVATRVSEHLYAPAALVFLQFWLILDPSYRHLFILLFKFGWILLQNRLNFIVFWLLDWTGNARLDYDQFYIRGRCQCFIVFSTGVHNSNLAWAFAICCRVQFFRDTSIGFRDAAWCVLLQKSWVKRA